MDGERRAPRRGGLVGWRVLVTAALIALAALSPAGAARAEVGDTALMGQNFWAVPWGGSDPFQPDAQHVRGPDPWKPGFIEEVTPYHIIRFMDWNHTNAHYGDKEGFQVQGTGWMDRKQKENPDQRLVAYEWQVDACNRTNSHGWFCAPEMADEDYFLGLAVLVKTGVDMLAVDLAPLADRLQVMTADDFVAAGGKRTGEPLAPQLRAYLEYSNETWLFQSKDMKELGAELGLTGSEYHAYKSVRLFHAFEQVFGRNSERIRKVVSGQAGNWGVGVGRFKAIYARHPVVNPGLIDKVDAYANATYWGPSAEDSARRWRNDREHIVDAFGVDYYFYEGGNGGAMPQGGVGVGAVKTPAMYDAYQGYFRVLEEVGYSAGCHYMHSGGREWACIQPNGVGLEKAMEFSKYRALVEYCGKIPLPRWE